MLSKLSFGAGICSAGRIALAFSALVNCLDIRKTFEKVDKYRERLTMKALLVRLNASNGEPCTEQGSGVV
jgi:hypothetical protein